MRTNSKCCRGLVGEKREPIFTVYMGTNSKCCRGLVHYTDLLALLRQIDPPLGFGSKCPDLLAYKRLVRMNMPVDEEGKVSSTVYSKWRSANLYLGTSVAYPDPSDPYVFGPHGSRIRIHESQVWIRIRILLSSSKIVRKTLIPTVFLLLFDFLSLKNDVIVPSKSNKQKIFFSKLIFCWRIEGQ
jgi:hypothetical protein